LKVDAMNATFKVYLRERIDATKTHATAAAAEIPWNTVALLALDDLTIDI
jgi:hypothetical protein